MSSFIFCSLSSLAAGERGGREGGEGERGGRERGRERGEGERGGREGREKGKEEGYGLSIFPVQIPSD